MAKLSTYPFNFDHLIFFTFSWGRCKPNFAWTAVRAWTAVNACKMKSLSSRSYLRNSSAHQIYHQKWKIPCIDTFEINFYHSKLLKFALSPENYSLVKFKFLFEMFPAPIPSSILPYLGVSTQNYPNQFRGKTLVNEESEIFWLKKFGDRLAHDESLRAETEALRDKWHRWIFHRFPEHVPAHWRILEHAFFHNPGGISKFQRCLWNEDGRVCHCDFETEISAGSTCWSGLPRRP